jgi:hypothetical protein
MTVVEFLRTTLGNLSLVTSDQLVCEVPVSCPLCRKRHERRRNFTSAAVQKSRSILIFSQKKATHLTSMLCLPGASVGVLGSVNAVWKLKVQGASPLSPLESGCTPPD